MSSQQQKKTSLANRCLLLGHGKSLFLVDVNLFLFGQFSDTIDGTHKVDSGNNSKKIQDVNVDDFSFIVVMDRPKVRRNPQQNCSNRVNNGPEPKLSSVLLDDALRRRNFIENKWNYANHVVVIE